MFWVRLKNPNSWIELFENGAGVYRKTPLRGRAKQSTNSQKPIFSDFFIQFINRSEFLDLVSLEVILKLG